MNSTARLVGVTHGQAPHSPGVLNMRPIGGRDKGPGGSIRTAVPDVPPK
jgi:hypothetical protein